MGIEKKTNLEENLLSGTIPEDTSIPSSISVIGLEIASEKTVPVDLIEKKTNLERIHLLGTTPGKTTDPTTISIIGLEDANDETPVEFKEMKTDLEKTTLLGTHPNEKEETSSTKRVERESYLAKMDDSDFTSSPVEFKEMKTDLEKTTLSGTNPNDAKEETASAKYVEMEGTNLGKIGISKSESFDAIHLRSENVYEKISSDVEKSWARVSCPPGFGQMTSQMGGGTKTMLNTSMTHPGAGCLRGMDISMDFCGLRYRERREVQWINFYNTTNDAMQEWKVSKMNMPDLLESSKNKIARGKVLLYILSGLLLLLAVALGALCYFYYGMDRWFVQ